MFSFLSRLFVYWTDVVSYIYSLIYPLPANICFKSSLTPSNRHSQKKLQNFLLSTIVIDSDAMAQEAEVVKKKQVMLKVYVTGLPEESDFNIRLQPTTSLKVPESSNNGVLVKNLFLSCDPFMRLLMQKPESSLQDVLSGYSPGSVSIVYLASCYWSLKCVVLFCCCVMLGMICMGFGH